MEEEGWKMGMGRLGGGGAVDVGISEVYEVHTSVSSVGTVI